MAIASLTTEPTAQPLPALQRRGQQPSMPVAAADTAACQTTVHTVQTMAGSLCAHSFAPPPVWQRPMNAAPEHCSQTRMQLALSCATPAVRVLYRPESLARPGGLVISGRLAAVCAELDRLVAMEELH